MGTLLSQPELHGAPVRFVGDLINRGPDSLGTLRLLISLGTRAKVVLGNHDLHLLAVAAGVRKPGRRDTLDSILAAPDRDVLIEWIRHQPLALLENGFLLVHAGVLPQWTVEQVMELAAGVEKALRGPNWKSAIVSMFGNAPAAWNDKLEGADRLRVTVNALTRLRFCTPAGEMEFASKGSLENRPAGFLPWFDVPDRKSADTTIVCGHWSAIGLLLRPNLMSIDTGCVWGSKLTAVQMAPDPQVRRVVQVDCQEVGLLGQSIHAGD
ncbi:Bis(5'-nucleosyl)-tetraphosphatase, symmetrical [Cupriavidus numazuensis]|uniref:bis(5'-nucleosyl)-tetraphosphatase (symmetrical) n=1 Tax=Cupriavidus numazuensis TaxID=221992 RepID=A0ABM8TRD8_9BURK|nr:Bis(5'-nucleosyl)-tetraphosphatase, symmetrical [Cupriavidus numazuensis]